MLFHPDTSQAVPSGTEITNTAQATYTLGGSSGLVSPSNTVTTTTVVVRTPATLELLQYAPTAPDADRVSMVVTECGTGGTAEAPFAHLPPPIPCGSDTPLNLTSLLPLVPATICHQGDPIFVRVTDYDQNLDALTAETVLVTLTNPSMKESELLRLTETGGNTGVFLGYIQTTSATPAIENNGTCSVGVESLLAARYTDQNDTSDALTTTILVDPYGIVFDSATGRPMDDAWVSLIDVTTGQPARVFGDDGQSTFPATVSSGGSVTDSGGKSYDFKPGGYRFPFIAPGTYRLDVVPPTGYRAPSAVPSATLQALPGAPFALAEPGSRGVAFTLNPGPAMNIDLPMDPVPVSLWVTKSTSKERVSVGDFLQYRVEVQNTSGDLIRALTLSDRLPLGFRYQEGSLTMGGATSPDPSTSSDGRTLTLPLSNLDANTTAEVRYVVEVAAGARMGTATNSAVAEAEDGTTSNVAHATVLVKEELFRSDSFLVGQVIPGACQDTPKETDMGVAGVRIYLEDGTYVVTDERGLFHFEGVKPGVHVVQLDLESLPEKYEVVACEENSRFAGRSYSQFIDLQGGTLWRTDFHVALKAPMTGEVNLRLKSTLRDNTIAYEVGTQGGGVPIDNLRLTVLLPEGVSYVEGSSIAGDTPLPDPEMYGDALTYRLGAFQGSWSRNVAFKATASLKGTTRELVTKALLTFDTPTGKNRRTPLVDTSILLSSDIEYIRQPEIVLDLNFPPFIAELTSKDGETFNALIKSLQAFEISHIEVVGHTDNVRIMPRNQATYVDNYSLSLARARSVGQYLQEALQLAPSQITTHGMGSAQPMATNKTSVGRDQNRRVEVRVMTEKARSKAFLKMLKKNGYAIAETTGLLPGETWQPAGGKKKTPAKGENQTPETIKGYDAAWIETAAPGLEWLWPGPDHSPAIPSIKLAFKHDSGETLLLLLDGSEVEPLNFDGTLMNTSGTVAASFWTGVDVHEGDNHFELIVKDASGNTTGNLKRLVHYSGAPVHVEVVVDASQLVANGKTPPEIAIRLTDKDGYPLREGVIGTFSVEAPHAAQDELDAFQKNPLSGMGKDKPRYVVGKNGIALLRLEPTSQSGEALIRVPLVNDEEELRVWLKPDARDWIIVGLAEGTMGYNTVAGHMENAGEAAVDEHLYEDGRIAFFAKGKIKGEWLMTMAYDNKKTQDNTRNSLHQTIDPDTYYTLYGDNTQQQYEAASARKLYLKIERDQFYALFGDYDTGLTVTELSRYSRSLNGYKAEMKAKHYSFNLFASETTQSFVKDEIRGDGTSGLYQLSRKSIVMNSEKITIETRDRFRSEVILATRTLTRHMDYNIDYDAGTLFFKEPVYSKDENLNPVFIVVDYESFDAGEEELTYGGRGAVKLMDDALEVGATYIHEGTTGAEADLQGVDAKVALGEKTELRAEFATTDRTESGAEIKGDAYLAELSHRSGSFDGQVYVREQDTGFGLGQQKGSETGTRKIGSDAAYHFNKEISVRGEVYRHFNLATDAERDLGEATVNHTNNGTALRLGLRHAEDRFTDGTTNRSDQVTVGVSRQLLHNRLQVRADREQSVGATNENPDFPTRTILGADFKLTESVLLFGEQEFTRGADSETRGTRLGMKTTPWAGGEVDTSAERQFNEYGPRAFANLGLRQTLNLTEKWGVDAGLDHSRTVEKPDDAPFNVNVPSSSGSDHDFTAVSMGTTYKEQNWSWASRVECRDADNEDKWGATTGVYSEPVSGIGLSAGLQHFRTEAKTGADTTDTDIRLGLAYRPMRSPWILLDRLDLKINEQEDPTSTLESWRIINNMNANVKPNRKTQVSLQYGLKYVVDTIDGVHYRGYTDLVGVEARYDLTKQWDVGLRTSVLHSWRSDQVDYSSGASLGYNVAENIWLSLGYNFTGFEDEDFSRGDFTAQGPFIQFRFKFDQKSVQDALKGFVSYREYGGRSTGQEEEVIF